MESNVYGTGERFGHHEHEGEHEHEEEYEERKEYARYIKEFRSGLTQVLLRHDFGRFPSVDVYQLLDVPGAGYVKADGERDLTNMKLVVYGGDDDADRLEVLIPVYREREFLGVSLVKMLDELHVRYDERRTLQDVVNDMFTNLLNQPNDEIAHGYTAWVRDNQNRTVGNLKQGGEWDDIRVGIRAQKVGLGQPGDPQMKVTQINYHSLMIEVTSPIPAADKLDLMFILNA